VTAERVVADVPGDARIGIEPADVLPLIGDLVDKSLVVATPEDAGVRYGLLETLREFALRRLVEAGDADVARDRHAAWCLGLAASARRQLHAADQVSWLRRLDQEHDNLRAALKWLVARDLAAAAELAADLAWYWWLRDHREEALAWLGRLLAESVELARLPCQLRQPAPRPWRRRRRGAGRARRSKPRTCGRESPARGIRLRDSRRGRTCPHVPRGGACPR
jgi:hypothetical protein